VQVDVNHVDPESWSASREQARQWEGVHTKYVYNIREEPPEQTVDASEDRCARLNAECASPRAPPSHLMPFLGARGCKSMRSETAHARTEARIGTPF
jgi:hypothetical protein